MQQWICPDCNGERTKTCQDCGGTGQKEDQTCPTCNGEGKESCWKCSGTGFID